LNRIVSTIGVAVALSVLVWGLGWIVFETFNVDSPTYFQNTMYLCLGLIWLGVALYLKRGQRQTTARTETRQTPLSLETAKGTETGDKIDKLIDAVASLDRRFADTHAFLREIVNKPQIDLGKVEGSLKRIEARLGEDNLLKEVKTEAKNGGEAKRDS
jgi:hypothetical protein